MRSNLGMPLYLMLAGLAAVALLASGCAKPRGRWGGHRAAAGVVGEAKAAVQVQGAPGPQKQQAPAAPAQAAEAKPAANEPSWEVRGWGQNQEEAEQDALRRAVGKVKDYLARERPPVRWTPTPDYIHDHLQTGPAQRHKDLDQDLPAPGGPIHVECWTIPVAITPAGREEIARLDAALRAAERERERADVSRGRMLILGRVLLAVVAGLLALLAYIRLDDWTKGYYSRTLAIGALGLLAAVGVGLWLCC